MKTAVIDSLKEISVFGVAGSTPELVEIAKNDSRKASEALNELERLAASLALGTETEEKFLDLGTRIFISAEETGFRRGFRVGARLMVESLGTPEELEAGGGE